MPGAAAPAKSAAPGESVEEGHGADAATEEESSLRVWLKVVGFGGLYIAVSSGLISFNKYLMHEDRFPFASFLVLLHMLGSTVFASVLRFLKPSLFPSLSDPARRVAVGCGFMFKNIVPIATLFSLQLVLSNSAYLHSTVAFLQMVKEANVVLVYLMSLAAMIEAFKLRNLCILLFIVAATSMCIHGELQFSWVGFALQGTSQFAESLKIVLQAMVLSGNSKLDAMSYVLLVAPCCAMSLLAIGAAQHFITPDSSFITAWDGVYAWAPYLLLNTLVAFSLNVVAAIFIKHTSGVAFILVGVAKDVMIVFVGAAFFSDRVSLLQTVGFSMQIGGVFAWCLVKTFPQNFEGGFFIGLARTLNPYSEPLAKTANFYGAANKS